VRIWLLVCFCCGPFFFCCCCCCYNKWLFSLIVQSCELYESMNEQMVAELPMNQINSDLCILDFKILPTVWIYEWTNDRRVSRMNQINSLWPFHTQLGDDGTQFGGSFKPAPLPTPPFFFSFGGGGGGGLMTTKIDL
jgi:hypothetical protein